MTLQAQLSLGGETGQSLGLNRVRLLEAVGREKSISAAARAVGLSYKAAWDAVDAMNNLFGKPLVTAQTGGRKGGGAELTAEGLLVLETYHRLSSEMSRTLQALEPQLTGAGIAPSDLMWRFMTKTSARNVLRATVVAITEGGVNSELTLKLTDNVMLTATITRDSVKELGLFPGRACSALIKAPFVMFAVGDASEQISAVNRIQGVVRRRENGPVSTEITLDIGHGMSLVGVVTSRSADDLRLDPGREATAVIDASHIILALSD